MTDNVPLRGLIEVIVNSILERWDVATGDVRLVSGDDRKFHCMLIYNSLTNKWKVWY